MLPSTWLDAEVLAQVGRAAEPFAKASCVSDPKRLLDWQILRAVLGTIPANETLVVSRGELLPLPVPRTLFALRAYLQNDIGLCLRRTERHAPSLATVAETFRGVGVPHVQLFVTPSSSHGLRWHFDDEHVMIVQIEGQKDYLFRANTVADVRADASVFSRFADETSPLMMATLVPGDVLYIPSRWWHMAECAHQSLSVSVGIMPASVSAAAVAP